jgi:uncharacterized protein involved in outer membrane biogenesis
MKYLFSTLAALLLTAGVIVLMGWKQVPDLIAAQISKKLKVDVDIKHISGAINTIYVEGIAIDNPEDSVLPQAFSCKKMTIHAAAANYLQEDVVIEEIVLDEVYFDLEFSRPWGKKGNWTTIMNNAYSSSEEQKEEQEGTVPTINATRSVLIRTLTLNRVLTDLVDRKKQEVKHLPPIDRIELHNLSSEGGPLTTQIFKLVIGQSIKAIFEELHIHHDLPGGHLKYLLPLRRFTSSFLLPIPLVDLSVR